MKLTLSRNWWRPAQQQLIGSLLYHQRWWVAGVMSAALVSGVLVIWWWLLRPLPKAIVVQPESRAQLDIRTLQQLTAWATARAQQYQPAGVASTVDTLFQ